MIEQELVVTLEQPPERAFDFFVDFVNDPAWNPECLVVEMTSEGPLGVGSTFTGRMRRVGQIKSEIVALERPSRCSLVERSRGAEGTFDFLFAPYDGGTRVEVRMRLSPRGPLRLLEPLMARMARKTLDRLPDTMRRGIDAAHPVR